MNFKDKIIDLKASNKITDFEALFLEILERIAYGLRGGING